VNRVGSGAVVYIAAPIGREIATREDPWLKHIISTCVKKFATRLAIDVEAPPGIQVVLGRRGAPDAASSLHVLSFVNHYSGLDSAVGKNSIPWVGPIRARIPLSTLGSKPKWIHPIGASGMKWTCSTDTLHIEMASVGHHAVLAIG
jgi:hypothetical protein